MSDDVVDYVFWNGAGVGQVRGKAKESSENA
jgi:hypothetical protein